MIDLSGSGRLHDNVRLCCYLNEAQRDLWPRRLCEWMGLSDAQAGDALALLAGEASPSDAQLERLASSLSLDPVDLKLASLLDNLGPNGILTRNVVRLLDGRGTVSQKDLAAEFGVSQETITRWRTLKRVPDKSAKQAIVRYFGLAGMEELEQKPLFLSFAPVTHAERVNWLQESARRMHPTKLNDLFPALMRLMSSS